RELFAERAHLARPVALAAFQRERQSNDERVDVIGLYDVQDRLDRWALAALALQRGQRRSDHAERITEREADATLAVVDGEDASHSAQAGEGIARALAACDVRVDGVECFGAAEQEATVGIATGAALDFEYGHLLAGNASEQVREQAGRQEAAGPHRTGERVGLDPVGRCERAHARM